MGDELLSEIVAAEREIRRQLTALREESAARLAAARSEAEEELRQEAARLEIEFARSVDEAERDARQESLAVVAEAEGDVARFDSLPAEILDGIIARHLHGIVWEDDHDRPDEQA